MRAKTIIGIFAVGMLVAAAWAAPGYAQFGSNQAGDQSLLDQFTYPTVNGPKITGTSAVLFNPRLDSPGGDSCFDLYMVFRVDSDFWRPPNSPDQSKYLYSFIHEKENWCLVGDGFEPAINEFNQKVTEWIVEELYPDLFAAGNVAVLRSISKYSPGGAGPPIYFTDTDKEFIIMDVVYSVAMPPPPK